MTRKPDMSLRSRQWVQATEEEIRRALIALGGINTAPPSPYPLPKAAEPNDPNEDGA